MKPEEFCAGEYLANRAADGRAYPEQGKSSLRDQSYDACALPEDNQTKPAALNAWATLAPLTFHEAILRIVRSQHHLNTENL